MGDLPTFVGDGETIRGNYMKVVGLRNFHVVGNYNEIQGERDFTVTGNYCKILSGNNVAAKGNYLDVYSTNGNVKGNYCNIYGTGNTVNGNYTNDQSRASRAREALNRLNAQQPVSVLNSTFPLSGAMHPLSRLAAPAPVPLPSMGDVPAPAPSITYPSLPQDPEASLGEDIDLNDPRLCSICLDRPRATVMVPCGHIYSCVTCAATQKPEKCNICRQPLVMVIRKYE